MQMEEAAMDLDFERAAMLRDGIREIERATLHGSDRPLAVTDTNVIMMIPASDRYATVEVYALRAGRLMYQRVIGTAAPREPLIDMLMDVFQRPAPRGGFTDRELDELQIITSWLYRRRERATTIVVRDVDQLPSELNATLNQYRRGDTEQAVAPPSEYSQLPEHDDYGV
jgi:excinuclease UvrABC nuclease subunit